MPSQEEYLDNLLKDVMNGEQASEPETTDGVHVNFFNGLPAEYDAPDSSSSPAAPGETEGAASGDKTGEPGPEAAEGSARRERYDIQDTASMSPEEIERILAENAGENDAPDRDSRGPVDLDTLLQEAEEANLKDIGDMLQKADRNEPVDEGIVALLEQAQQQNAEIEWKDIDEYRQIAPPKAEKGLKKLFGKLRRGKKGEKGRKKKSAELPEENTGSQEEVLTDDRKFPEAAGEDPVSGEMEELFGAMEAVGAGQAPAEEQEKENGVSAGEKPSETAGNVLPPNDAETEDLSDGGWPELQGLSLGNIGANRTASQDNAENEEDAAPGEDMGLNDLLESLGISDDLENAGESGDGQDEDEALGVPDAFGGTEDERREETQPGTGEGGEVSKKKKKEKDPSGRKGLFGRLLDFLTQEDPEDGEEGQQIILSDENDAILKELNEENAKQKKKKKKAKKKKGAEKEDSREDLEDEEETGAKKGKKQKKVKPKKMREPVQKEPEEPGKRLSARRVILIFLICGAFGGAILVLGSAGIDFADKKKAASAFYEGDYETCYQNLTGKRLNESQQVMYGKSESILRMRLWMREYEMFVQAGQEPEALDSLLQSVKGYPEMYRFSSQWNAAEEVQEIYGQMLGILQSKYGLTEEMAEAIAEEWDDLEYSKIVRTIAGGGEYSDWDQETDGREPGTGPEEELEDLLPEEEELGGAVFAD